MVRYYYKNLPNKAKFIFELKKYVLQNFKHSFITFNRNGQMQFV